MLATRSNAVVTLSVLIVALAVVYLVGTRDDAARQPIMPEVQEAERANLANPASVSCVQSGGVLELKTGAAGGQVGICAFADGRRCEEWALYRDGTCVPQ